MDRAAHGLPGDAESDWAEAEALLSSDRLALCAQEALEQLHGGPSAETARLWDAEIDA